MLHKSLTNTKYKWQFCSVIITAITSNITQLLPWRCNRGLYIWSLQYLWKFSHCWFIHTLPALKAWYGDNHIVFEVKFLVLDSNFPNLNYARARTRARAHTHTHTHTHFISIAFKINTEVKWIRWYIMWHWANLGRSVINARSLIAK